VFDGVLAISLVGCGSSHYRSPTAPSVEQRMADLERRVEKLEARPAVEAAIQKQGGDRVANQGT